MNDTTGYYYETNTSFGFALDKLIEYPGYGIRLKEWNEGVYLDLVLDVEERAKKELQLVNKYFYPITWLPKEYELFSNTWEIVTEEYKEAYKEMKNKKINVVRFMKTDQLPANELSGILNYMEKFLHAVIDIWEMRYRFFYFVINNRRENDYQSHLGVIIDYLNDSVKETKCSLRHKQLCGIICRGANLTKENQEKINQFLV